MTRLHLYLWKGLYRHCEDKEDSFGENFAPMAKCVEQKASFGKKWFRRSVLGVVKALHRPPKK